MAIEDPQILARRGRLAAELLNGDLWRDFIEPDLAVQQDKDEVQRGWRPSDGIKTVDEVALKGAYFSGSSDRIGEFKKMLQRYVEHGQEAEKELEGVK